MLDTLKQNPLLRSLTRFLPDYFIENMFLSLFGLAKIPILFFLSPKVVQLTEQKCIIRIPLNWRSKNHVGSMYFGALAAGADCAGGFLAMKIIYTEKLPVQMVFKDFHADFHQRATGATFFVCEDGQSVREALNQTMRTGERVNQTVIVKAYVVDVTATDPVATFALTLSVKKKVPLAT